MQNLSHMNSSLQLKIILGFSSSFWPSTQRTSETWKNTELLFLWYVDYIV